MKKLIMLLAFVTPFSFINFSLYAQKSPIPIFKKGEIFKIDGGELQVGGLGDVPGGLNYMGVEPMMVIPEGSVVKIVGETSENDPKIRFYGIQVLESSNKDMIGHRYGAHENGLKSKFSDPHPELIGGAFTIPYKIYFKRGVIDPGASLGISGGLKFPFKKNIYKYFTICGAYGLTSLRLNRPNTPLENNPKTTFANTGAICFGFTFEKYYNFSFASGFDSFKADGKNNAPWWGSVSIGTTFGKY